MDTEIRDTVDALCTTVQSLDSQLSEHKTFVQAELAGNDDRYKNLRDMVRAIDKELHEIKEVVETFKQQWKDAVFFIVGAFSGMGYHESGDALSTIFGIKPPEES